MTRFTLVITFASLCLCATLQGQLKPTVGAPAEILYRPAPDHPFASAEALEIVYAFNYWGTRLGTRLALFENVLRPDSGREQRSPMLKTSQGWTARIDIPENAAVLSYYFTDGRIRDDNNEKTYAFHVFGADGKPVRNARYFMTMFLGMARASLDDRIREAEAEIRAYPENFRAWPLYFSLRFERGRGSDRVREQIEEELEDLERRYPENEELLNLSARTRFYTLRDIQGALRIKDRIPLTVQWPEVLLIHDREQIEEQKRRFTVEREQTRAALTGAKAPSIAYLDTARARRAFAADEGRVVLAVFWASVSAQSRLALRQLAVMKERIQTEDFRVIAINVDADEVAARNYMREAGLPFFFGFAQGSLIQEFGVDGIPQLYLIDRTGIIRHAYTGVEPDDLVNIEAAVRELLAAPQ